MSATIAVIAALGRRAVKQAFRRPQFLAPVLVFPTLLLAINTGGAGRATEIPGFPEVAGFLDFEMAGAMLQATMFAGLSGGIAMALDIELGFTDRLVAAPIPRYAIVLGRLVGSGAIGLLVGVWFLAGGLIFGAQIMGGVPGVLLILALTVASATAFGGVGCAIALRAGRVSTTQGLFPLIFVILFVSTAFFPADLMLQPASAIAEFNPFSFIADGIREPIISTIAAGPVLAAVASILAIGVVGLGLSGLALRARLRAG